MTTKKPKAPVKTTKKPASPAKSGKPSLSQQKRLKALMPHTEAPKSLPEPLKTFRELRDDHEKALAARIPYLEPVEFYPQARVGAPPLPAAQKRDKRLLYAAIGVVALGVVVYYGGFL